MLDNKFLKDQYSADQETPALVHKLFASIHETIKLRKSQIDNPYWEDNQPKLIYLRPIPRPAYSLLDPQKHKTMRRLYGQHVEKITEKFRVSLLNVDELNCSQRVLFDDFGNLSAYGIERFWKSLSDHFRRADRDEYYAVKNYRAPKKSVATQTYTQTTNTQVQPNVNQQTPNQTHGNPAGDNSNYPHQPVHFQNHQPYQYHHGVNDHYHYNKYQ